METLGPQIRHGDPLATRLEVCILRSVAPELGNEFTAGLLRTHRPVAVLGRWLTCRGELG
jgi:hypothetical protein